MKTIIIVTVCILFAGCATPKAPVPSSGAEAELAACKKSVAELAVCKKRVAELEQKIACNDSSPNIQIFDE